MVKYIASIIFLIKISISVSVKVNINTGSPARTISEKFLSFTFDSQHAFTSNWDGCNLTFIQPLAKALGPAYFRFGGGAADMLVFQESKTLNSGINLMNASSVIFTGNQLDQLYNFSSNVGWRLIFDLNLMLRSGSHWDSRNALQFLNYANKYSYEMDFELGNEPDGFPSAGQFNVTIGGAQIAQDYGVLRDLLNTFGLYADSKIIGPSISYWAPDSLGKQIIIDFLNNGGGNYINGLTFHFYYVAGATAKLNDFLNYTVMDKLLNSYNTYNELSYTPKWLGEAASAYNGGAPNMSDTYVDGFLWLDMIGLSALHGMEVILRQQLHGFNYSLIDYSLSPNHDYWVSLLYKKLIGSQVYNLSVDETDLNLRLYAASSKNINKGVVIYGVRIINESVTLDFPQFSTRKATVYIFKEGESGNLQSKTSKLNNQLLEWNQHQPGANYQGILTNLPITIPGYSQFFIVVDPNTETSCPNGWYKETTISNKCVKVIKETQPLFGAKIDCSTYGNNASILSIDNSFENSEIYKAAQSQGCSQFYIGLARNGTSWTWSNGDSSNYYNWKNGYPTSDNTKNCVSLDTTSGTWSNEDCGSFRCYICQKYV